MRKGISIEETTIRGNGSRRAVDRKARSENGGGGGRRDTVVAIQRWWKTVVIAGIRIA